MTILFRDRVQEITTTVGTGAYALPGVAPSTYRTFANAYVVDADVTKLIPYCCVNDSGTEIGYGNYTAANTLSRHSVVYSTNANALVDWGAGNKTIFVCVIADLLATFGAPTYLAGSGTATATGARAIAAGPDASATGDSSAAVGDTAVASGNNATALGESATASGNNSAAVGAGTTASGTGAGCVAGVSNEAAGYASVVAAGQNNVAHGDNSAVVGGTHNATEAVNFPYVSGPLNAVVLGGMGAVAIHEDSLVTACQLDGQYQHEVIPLGIYTNDATPTALKSSNGNDHSLVMPINTCWNIEVLISAFNQTDHNVASTWVMRAGYRRGTAGAPVLLAGGPANILVGQDAGAAAWAVALSIDGGDNAIQVVVTGQAAKTILWSARVTLVQASNSGSTFA